MSPSNFVKFGRIGPSSETLESTLPRAGLPCIDADICVEGGSSQSPSQLEVPFWSIHYQINFYLNEYELCKPSLLSGHPVDINDFHFAIDFGVDYLY